MGSRYARIVEYLGLNPVIHDSWKENVNALDADLIIDAAPTSIRDHTVLFAEKRPKKRFLLEKPLCKGANLGDLPRNIRMINQYEYYLADRLSGDVKIIEAVNTKKETVYDYWRSGKDGLIWDCINIVGLADDDSDLDLRQDSLIWNCVINNQVLDISKMDVAYVWNIYDWLIHQDENVDYIYRAHNRCQELSNE